MVSDHILLNLMGNVYWFSQDKEAGGDVPRFLLCFDFTAERFVPRLPLPFESYFEDEVWVTTKIETNGVSWSKFLAVDMSPLTWFQFFSGGSFLIDEEKRVVVVFDGDKNESETNRNTAYFVGENDYFK
uniref:F-box associated beta-propeller type 1 domain-containing protein n=1 Tax=Brassica oleracea var. oleracea TaxID=109376 RepID=A0A0D3CJS8_BRAOL